MCFQVHFQWRNELKAINLFVEPTIEMNAFQWKWGYEMHWFRYWRINKLFLDWISRDWIPCSGGRCISSKSPCVTAMSHQIIAKNSQERMKLRANTISVHLHWESTRVVNISCRNRTLRREIFFCNTLQSLKHFEKKERKLL